MKHKESKEQYDSITALYDMAEELAGTVESKLVKDPDGQLAIVEPLINEIADAADIMTEEYINVLEDPAHKKSATLKVEKALRKIFLALENYRKRVTEQGRETLLALSNIADPIVDKIAKQTEKVMLIFMRLMEISLERIMRKHEMDEFRRHHAQLMNALPQHSH